MILITPLPNRSTKISSTGSPPIISTPILRLQTARGWIIENAQKSELWINGRMRRKYTSLTPLRLFAPSFPRESISTYKSRHGLTVTFHRRRYAPPMQVLLKKQTDNVFFNENLVTSHFPSVHIFYLVCGSSVWFCMWAYMETMRLHKEAKNRKQIVRATSFHSVDGANHFVSALRRWFPKWDNLNYRW